MRVLRLYKSLDQNLMMSFRAYHTNPYNVMCHMITTPSGIISILVIMFQNCTTGTFFTITSSYIFSLYFTLRSNVLWCLTTLCMLGLMTISMCIASYVSFTSMICLLALSYIGQEVSHVICQEETYESSYSNIVEKVEHIYYLLPLCLDALTHVM